MRRSPRRLVLVALAVVAVSAGVAAAATLTQVSTDPYPNTTSQHKTEVEPDTFAWGNTLVAAFQVGRFNDGGASNIGWSALVNGTSSSGFLPSLTTYSPGGPYARATDPSVAYDDAHKVWLINSLGLSASVSGAAVVVNRWDTAANSAPTWSGPITVASASGNQDFDKNWIVCDNVSVAHKGTCYVEWDDFGNNNQLHVAYSTNGGLTWTQGSTPSASVLGGQPVVQPNGHVVMPIANGNTTTVESFVSSDGGATFSGPYPVATIASHGEAGGLRSDPLPSAEVDASGKVYVAWDDCRFIRRCTANDIVYSTSTDGQTWSAVTRVPIDSVNSGVDHFLPGLAVDPATSGNTTRLGLTYYFYPVSKCAVRRTQCELRVGYVSSTNAGSSWGTPTTLASGMSLNWLPQTTQGRMVGDYISTSFLNGSAYSVFAVANAPTGGSDCASATPNCDQEMYMPAGGLAASGGTTVSTDLPVPNAASDHASPHSAIFTR